MEFFQFKPEESEALKAFQKKCVRERLELSFSKQQIDILVAVYNRKPGDDIDLPAASTNSLLHRGFLRMDEHLSYQITEVAVHVVALAQAGVMFGAIE